ncbi:MAG: hypothetical protein ACE5R6_03765 [Candidatus Heimdallarchaeota archaeon]
MSNGRPLAAVILTSYIGIRLIWEVYSYPLTMSPKYAILNFSVLLPMLIALVYAVYVAPESKRVTWFIFGSSSFYLLTYLVLGIVEYPLLFTLRVDNPKSLFIDVFTLCIVISSFLYTIWLIRSSQYL